jgi:hypothetical protein
MWSGFTGRLGNYTRRARDAIERGTRRVSSAYASARGRATETAASARARAAEAAASARGRAAEAAEIARTHASTVSNRIHSTALTAKNRVVQSVKGFSEDVQNKLHDLKHSLGQLNLTVIGDYITANVIGEENMEAFKEKLRRLRLVKDIIIAAKDKDFEGFLKKYNHSKGSHGTDMNWLMQNISTLIFPVYLLPNFLLKTTMHFVGSSLDEFGVLLLKVTEIIPLLSDEETAKYHGVYINMNPKETKDLEKLKNLFEIDFFNPTAKADLSNFSLALNLVSQVGKSVSFNALNITAQTFRGLFFGLNEETKQVMEDKLRGFNDEQLSEILELLVNVLKFAKGVKPRLPSLPEYCSLEGNAVTLKTQLSNLQQCLVDNKQKHLDLPLSFLLELVKTMAIEMHQFPIYKSILVFAMAVLHEIKLHMRKPRGHKDPISNNIWRLSENMLLFDDPAAYAPPPLLPSGPNLEPPKVRPPPPTPLSTEFIPPPPPYEPPRDSSNDDEFFDAESGEDVVDVDEEPVKAVPSVHQPDVVGPYTPGTGLLPRKGLTLKEGRPTLTALVQPYGTGLGGRRKTRKPRRRPKRKSAYRKRY